MGASWLQQTFAWSNRWSAWQERLIASAFLVAGAGLIWLSTKLYLWQAVCAWAVYGVALAICSRQGWMKLFGPVLFYDMVRTSRRSRYVVMRLLYAGLLLCIICMMFLTQYLDHRHDERREAAMLGERFFAVFMLVQITMVVLLTPAYVAGAIAEEKDRRTLEFLMATDLRNREIVLSKLLSRLANLTLFLLTGLPILSILQFIGGVDAQLMLSGFAGTGLTMLGIASLSILMSTLFKRPRDAIGITYLCLIAYMSVGTVAFTMEMARSSLMQIPILWSDNTTIATIADVAHVFNAGNPIVAIVNVAAAIEGHTVVGGRTTLAAELSGIMEDYAWFHMPLALVCVVWSIVRLRAIALKQSVGGTTAKVGWWQHYRTPVGEQPMLWKEFHIEGGIKLNWLGLIAVVALVLLTVGSGILVFANYAWEATVGGGRIWLSLSESMNIWFRIAGTGVACLLILYVAVRASSSISNERERDTFDALITTPMTSDAILAAKVLGCVTSLRLGWVWFGCMLVMAIFTGGIHLLAVPIVIAAWLVYAVFFTLLGVWFSMTCKSSMRATVYTVLTTLLVGGGHWLVLMLCCSPIFYMTHFDHPGRFPEFLLMFQAGMTPPFVLGFCAFSWDELAQDFRHGEHAQLFFFCLIGLFLWAIACVIFWFGLLVPKFRHLTRSEELLTQ